MGRQPAYYLGLTVKPIDNIGSDCTVVKGIMGFSCSVLPARGRVCGERREESKITEII